MFDADSGIGGVIRQNWALIVAMAILLTGAGFAYMYSNADRDGTSAVADAAVAQPNGSNSARALPTQPKRKTPQELALELIAEHEAKVEANPDDEDSPAYLLAMGNLYRHKLVDYEKAAECYKRLLMDYPDWKEVRLVYSQLATCYERLDETEKAIDVYEQMLKVFPPQSQEYAYAHAKVYR